MEYSRDTNYVDPDDNCYSVVEAVKLSSHLYIPLLHNQ